MFKLGFEKFSFENNQENKNIEELLLEKTNSKKYKELAYSFLFSDKINETKNIGQRSLLIDKAEDFFSSTKDFVNNFLPLEKSLEIIEKCQQEKKSNNFLDLIEENLEKKFPNDFKIKILSTIGDNHLKKVFGIDAVVKIINRISEEDLAYTLIDLNGDSEKLETNKADINLDINKDESLEIRRFVKGERKNLEFIEEKIEEYSRLIKLSLDEKLKNEISLAG